MNIHACRCCSLWLENATRVAQQVECGRSVAAVVRTSILMDTPHSQKPSTCGVSAETMGVKLSNRTA